MQTCWLRSGVLSAAVVWAHNNFRHLWFWQWILTLSAIHGVEKDIFLQRSWALPSFEERVLAGVRLCRFLLSCFCFLAHPGSHLLFFQGKQILALLKFHFQCILFLQKAALVDLHCEILPSCLRLDERSMYFDSRLLFWLVECVFRTNFTRAFFSCVNLSMYEISDLSRLLFLRGKHKSQITKSHRTHGLHKSPFHVDNYHTSATQKSIPYQSSFIMLKFQRNWTKPEEISFYLISPNCLSWLTYRKGSSP